MRSSKDDLITSYNALPIFFWVHIAEQTYVTKQVILLATLFVFPWQQEKSVYRGFVSATAR